MSLNLFKNVAYISLDDELQFPFDEDYLNKVTPTPMENNNGYVISVADNQNSRHKNLTRCDFSKPIEIKGAQTLIEESKSLTGIKFWQSRANGDQFKSGNSSYDERALSTSTEPPVSVFDSWSLSEDNLIYSNLMHELHKLSQ
ncbi:MAG: hypothetical protein ACON35_00355 [Candidatus Marinamargulisbacteria bacterium]